MIVIDDEDDEDYNALQLDSKTRVRLAKRRSCKSATSGSLNLQRKMMTKVSKKPGVLMASLSKLHPALTSTMADPDIRMNSGIAFMKILYYVKEESSDLRLITQGANEGTGNHTRVPDESTVISRASSEGTGSKPGVPDEEKLIL
ncbi:hypothetical protein Tco_0392842 [Tanacetum coccineum]